MRTMPRFVVCVMVTVAIGDAAAQGRAGGAVQGSRDSVFRPSPGIFRRLFAAPARDRLRPPPAAPPRAFGRVRPASRECAGCEDRPGGAHVVFDSPRITDEWLDRHTYQANGTTYGDNSAVADFWYDAVHRRIFTRSLVLQEVEDPADLRLGRATGRYPNEPDFGGRLEPGTTVGHVGFVQWGSNGFGSYFAAVQGAVRDAATGYLDLATATGQSGRTRTGSSYGPEDLIKHVRLHPSGQLEVGFETDPPPDATLVVRGNAQIEGTLVVGGAPIEERPALSCRVHEATVDGTRATAACDAGAIATGGGGRCASGDLRASLPILSGETPSGWELTCGRGGAHTVYVICCAR